MDVDPSPDELDAELTVLHRRVLGTTPDIDELAELADAYATVQAQEGTAAAWSTVVAILLRDPAFWSY